MNFTEYGKRMDRFDAVVHEYLRANRKSVEYLAEKAGCNASSLWRYRKREEAFKRMPDVRRREEPEDDSKCPWSAGSRIRRI